jgi:hypothetical protein
MSSIHSILSGTRPWLRFRFRTQATNGLKPGVRWQEYWLLLVILVLLSGCATLTSSHPDADQNLPMKLGRVQVLEQHGVTVHVSIPTDDKASGYFGVPLSRYGIQPTWIRIENASDVDFWLMPIAVDPDYYSADEAAMVTGAQLSKESRIANRRRFRTKALSFFSPANSTQEPSVASRTSRCSADTPRSRSAITCVCGGRRFAARVNRCGSVR